MKKNFRISREVLMDLIATHIEKNYVDVVIDRASSLGILNSDQAEHWRYYISSEDIDITLDVKNEPALNQVPQVPNDNSSKQEEFSHSHSQNAAELYAKFSSNITDEFPADKIVTNSFMSEDTYREFYLEMQKLSIDDRASLLLQSTSNINLFIAIVCACEPRAIAKVRDIEIVKEILDKAIRHARDNPNNRLDLFYTEISVN